MNKRPFSVTILSLILLAAGLIGLIYHLTEFKASHPFASDIIWISLVRLIAVVSGVFMLRGSSWGRWLAIVWLAFHVVLSAFHSWTQLAVHVLFLTVFAYFLFRPQATAYFHARTQTPEGNR
jgi:hypothetical protein